MAGLQDIEITSSAFAEVVGAAGLPVVVDFWAPWCGSCRLLAPAVMRLSAEQGDRVRVLSLNVEAAPDIAETYNVRSLPTILVFQAGRETKRLTGVRNYGSLVAELEAVLN